MKLASQQHQHGAGNIQHKAGIDTTPPFKGGPFGLHQACLESAQTLHETKAWSTHQQPVHPCQHIGALWLLSAPYHKCNDIRSLCVLTRHGTHGSLSFLCNSSYHIESWLLPSPYLIDLSTTFEAIWLQNWRNMQQCILLLSC
jgi:hypothetical protein